MLPAQTGINVSARFVSIMEYTAYDVKAKKKVKISDPEVVKMKNGRWAVSGKSSETGTKVFRILSKEELSSIKK